jgi:hypothetical protein
MSIAVVERAHWQLIHRSLSVWFGYGRQRHGCDLVLMPTAAATAGAISLRNFWPCFLSPVFSHIPPPHPPPPTRLLSSGSLGAVLCAARSDLHRSARDPVRSLLNAYASHLQRDCLLIFAAFKRVLISFAHCGVVSSLLPTPSTLAQTCSRWSAPQNCLLCVSCATQCCCSYAISRLDRCEGLLQQARWCTHAHALTPESRSAVQSLPQGAFFASSPPAPTHAHSLTPAGKGVYRCCFRW